MAVIEKTVSGAKYFLQAITTIGLVIIGFFLIFFASAKATRFNQAFGGGVSQADVPAGSGTSSSGVTSSTVTSSTVTSSIPITSSAVSSGYGGVGDGSGDGASCSDS